MLKPKKVKTKVVSFEALQFTGKNSKDIAEWIFQNEGKAKAGGSYVNVTTDDGEFRLIKSDWIVKGEDNSFYVFGDALFFKIVAGK